MCALAVTLGAIAYFTGRTSRPASARLNGEKVLPTLDISRIASIDVGERLQVVSEPDGWKLKSMQNYPADNSKIAENLLKLAELKVGQSVRGKKMEKSEKLVLKDAGGAVLHELNFGEKHPKWGHGRYAEYKGESVLLSDALDCLDGEIRSWCDTKITDEPRISFVKLAEPGLDEAVLGFATGTVATVTCNADTNRTVTIGNVAPGGNNRYLRLNGEKWIYEVSEYSVKNLLPKPEKTEPKIEP